MRPTESFVKDFLDNLKNGTMKKDSQSNNGPELTEAFVKKKVDNFKKVMEMDLVGQVLNGTGAE